MFYPKSFMNFHITVHVSPHEAPSGCSYNLHGSTWFSSANSKTGVGSSLIQNVVCKRNSSTNKLMSIRHLEFTCEAWGYAAVGKKKQLSSTSSSQYALYLAARANHTFCQIQQGVCSGIYLQSTARMYHRWFSNAKAWSPGTVPQMPQFIATTVSWNGAEVKNTKNWGLKSHAGANFRGLNKILDGHGFARRSSFYRGPRQSQPVHVVFIKFIYLVSHLVTTLRMSRGWGE